MSMFHLSRLTIPTGNLSKLAPIYAVNARRSHQRIGRDSNLQSRSKSVALDGGYSCSKMPQFEDVRLIYSNKDWKQLLRAFFVFSLASWPFLANNHLKVLRWSRTLLGGRAYKSLMRATIYGQFMAGERTEEVLKVAKRNSEAGIYAMFAYTASEQHGQSSILEAGQSEDSIRDVNYKALQEGLQTAAAAKEFSSYTPQLTLKLTFFMAPELLVDLTRLVSHQTTLLEQVASDTDASRRVEFSQYIQTIVNKASESYHGSDMVIPQQQSRLDTGSLALSLPFHLELSHSKELLTFVKNIPPNYKPLSSGEENQLVRKWQDLVKLGQLASDEGVSMMIDAEQTYLQRGIEIIAIDMMRKHNKTRPVVYNTYQCYLKSMYDVVVRDLDLASREGFWIGLKVVRGAYVDEESARAVAMGYESPLNPSYEATTEMYEKVSTTLLENLARSGRKCCHVTFATHNLDSVKFIINRINDLDLRLEDRNITFAQLLGMRDYISFPLAHEGFIVAKLLHYGPVEGAVAYLARRLAENKAGLTAVNLERRLAWKEMKRRIIGF